MPKLLMILALALTLAGGAKAQTPEAIFKDYDHMRAVLDKHMMSREIEAVMRAFGASDEMTDEQLKGLEGRVRGIFPFDFRHVHILKTDDMGAGWGRELYAYWAGTNYIYATVLYHQREKEFVAISFRFNTDIKTLIGEF